MSKEEYKMIDMLEEQACRYACAEHALAVAECLTDCFEAVHERARADEREASRQLRLHAIAWVRAALVARGLDDATVVACQKLTELEAAQ